MNELSWLLYFGDFCDHVEWMFCFVSFIPMFYGLIVAISRSYLLDNTANYDKDYPVVLASALRGWRTFPLWIVLGFFVFFLGSLIPSKNTVYAIAASQMGEKALKTPLVNKAEQALEAWMDKQIAVVNPPQPQQ
jgi:hypothetical protein